MTFGEAFFGLSWLDAIIRILIVVGVMTLVVVYLTYGERKVVARFQMRLGPTRTGPLGLLQGFADAIKLLIKEDLRPRNADRWVFEFAPYLTFIPCSSCWWPCPSRATGACATWRWACSSCSRCWDSTSWAC